MDERVVTADLARVPTSEFRARQDRLRDLARARGLSAVVAWSRGATTQDQYADVYYLSNFYSHYPSLPDEEQRWSAKGYMGMVVPVDGPATLLTDLSVYRDDLTVADQVVSSQDVIGALAETLNRDAGEGQIGILGSKPLSFTWYAQLVESCGARFVVADDLGPELRLIKSAAEQALLRAAGTIGVRGVEAMMDAAVPGATEAEVAAAGFGAVVAAGGMIYGLSISSGDWAHSYSQSQPAPFDSRYVLRAGDMIRIDFYGSVDGYLFDFGRSRVVGRAPDDDQRALLDAARDAVRAGVAAIAPGRTLGSVARACEGALAASDYTLRGLGLPAEFGSWGHSLGLNWEQPWIDTDSEVVIEPGMCLAVEKRVAVPGVGGATYEDNVLVTPDGCEVITPARAAYGEHA